MGSEDVNSDRTAKIGTIIADISLRYYLKI